MSKSNKIEVKGTVVTLFNSKDKDFISLTDIARYRDSERSDYILQNWMRNRSTIEFVGLWELFNNPDFHSIEFDGIKKMAGSNSFSLTPKRWIETTNAIGIVAKINYRIHTDAIKENIIPENLSKEQTNQVYANEADVLNVALFGKTAKQWREENPDSEGNIRDLATIEQLLVLANMESLNAEFIKMSMTQSEPLIKLNKTAISQMKSLALNNNIKKLKE